MLENKPIATYIVELINRERVMRFNEILFRVARIFCIEQVGVWTEADNTRTKEIIYHLERTGQISAARVFVDNWPFTLYYPANGLNPNGEPTAEPE